tara:strand:+ start:4660 stop:4917 length:258 start_codon:yes stop_codon:yes gene_type:complete
MKTDEIADLFKFCSPHSILVMTWYNKVKELYCPFAVQAKVDIGTISQKEVKEVSAVKLSSKGTTIFIIEDQAYFYYYFEILLHPL